MKTRLPALLAVCLLLFGLLPVSLLAADTESSPASAPASPVDSTASANPSTLPAVEAGYKIAEEDVLRLDVWGESQLSNVQLAVAPGGTIIVPFLGETSVVGMTQDEVSRLIAKKLADADIVYDAKVQVALVQLHRPQARILGAVQRPGSFEFKTGDTLWDLVGQGGSFADDALLENATLTRKGEDKTIKINLKKIQDGDLTDNLVLQNGDALYIPHEEYTNKFYVLGQVYKPGQYSLKDKTTILSAITLAGGPTDRGAIRSTVVIRGDLKKPERVKTNLKALFDRGDLSQDLTLQAGDIVLVPETKKPNWGNISAIINTMFNLRYLTRYGLF